MTDPTQVEYLEIKQQRKLSAKFLWIVLLSICIMAVVSLLISFVYLVTVDKMTPEERLEKEAGNIKKIDDCKNDKNCLSSKIQSDPNFNCTDYLGSKDPCYLEMARIRGDPNYCTKISDLSMRDECIFVSSPKMENAGEENV